MQILLNVVRRWMEAAGFEPIEEVLLFKDKCFIIFGGKS